MFILATLSALAAPPTDASIGKLASAAVGKTVPAKYLCIQHVELTHAAFTGSPTPVGIKMKGQGCVLKGVVVAGRWYSPGAALPAAVPTWAALDDADKSIVAMEWSRDVMLPFYDLGSGGRYDNGTFSVDGMWREASPQTTSEGTIALSFGADGTVDKTVKTERTWRTGMALQQHSIKGEDPTEAMEAKGKLIKRCVYDAWQDDPRIEGRTRLSWTVTNGAVGNLTVKGLEQGELAQCYANAISQLDFPSDGKFDYSFAITTADIAR